MTTLFPVDPVLPKGFMYYPDFLSEDEEKDLLGMIPAIGLHSFLFHGFEAKRKVASFGYDYNFEKRSLARGHPIPSGFLPLVKRVSSQLGVPVESIAELLVTEYPEGSVINWHRDAPPFEVIAGISLLSDCTFRLRPQEKALQNRRSTISLPVSRRSLYVMQGPARSAWQHSTAPVLTTRYSITLRTIAAR